MSQPTRPTDRPNRVEHAYELVGYTPVVRLNRLVPKGSAKVYVKLESANPGGSVKDRIALSMIQDAEARGELVPVRDGAMTHAPLPPRDGLPASNSARGEEGGAEEVDQSEPLIDQQRQEECKRGLHR